MNGLSPLAALYDVEHGRDAPLPPALAALYGRLQFPLHASRPYVLGNFVSTLDGVVTLNMPGQSGGGPISGFNPHDHLVIGLLRAVADAIIVGAGTLRAIPEHRWTAAYIAPAYAEAYQELRTRLGKPDSPLNVIVTARGVISLDLPVFQSGEVPVLLVTTTQGEERIREQPIPPSVQIAAVQRAGVLSAHAIVQAVCEVRPCQVILVEGGPRLLGDFFAEQVLDELLLTLAPQLAGRDASTKRPGLVEGRLPTIFEHSIDHGTAYDEQMRQLIAQGKNAQTIYETLAMTDVRHVADLLRPLYDRTDGQDGFVSIEDSPYLAQDTEGTLAEVRRFWHATQRPNLMVKIPSTPAGVPAIRQALTEGININITLIFSIENYRQVAEAYLSALEERLAASQDIHRIASVASFFVSRMDVLVDHLLEDKSKAAGTSAKRCLAKQPLRMPAWPTRSSNGCLAGHALRPSSSTERVCNDHYGPAPA